MYYLQPMTHRFCCNNAARIAFDDEDGNLIKKVIRKCTLPADHPGLHVDEFYLFDGEMFEWETPENAVEVKLSDV